MVRTGPLARDLAFAFHASPESAFTTGLLHDVGKLVVFDRLAAMRIDLHRDLDLPPRFLSNVLASMHGPLGGAMALSWRLGDGIARVLLSHHRDAFYYENETLSEVVCVAERLDLYRHAGLPLDFEALWAAAALTGDRAAVESQVAEDRAA
jgi:HD-like signal output (HDOD) protein